MAENTRPNLSLLPSERQRRIVELLRQQMAIRVSELSALLEVSEMTIRRDLETLEKGGKIERTHGGAVFRQERLVAESVYRSSQSTNRAAKARIGRLAATLIRPHDIVFANSGITTTQAMIHLPDDLEARIVTNNLGPAANGWEKAVRLTLTGGTLRPASFSLVGPGVIETIQRVYATKTILGLDGLSLKAGLTTPSAEEAAINRAMIDHTHGQVIVLADHSKFGRVAEMVIAPVARADVIITDRDIPLEYQEQLKLKGVAVLIAANDR